RDGVKPDEVSIIGVGTGLSAVAAMKNGEIDAIVNLDPVMTKLDQDGDIVILADSRTDEGNMKLFGGNNPAAVVYLKTDFISKNPVTVQHLVNAFYKATKWLEKATPEDIVKTVPEEYFLGDKALYLSAFKASKPMYSTTGILTPQGMQNGLNLLLQRDPDFTGDRFSACYFDADFADFLAWRDWGFPDRSVFNGFGMGALRCSDGAFVLGEMGHHTANAGRIYFPSGTPDPDDIRDGAVDIAGSVAREVEEETGLTSADYRAGAHG